MGNYLKSKKSGMIGFTVNVKQDADDVVNYFIEKGTNLAWIDNYKEKFEVLISENELKRINIRCSDVSKEVRDRGIDISWPSIYGDPHFSFL